MLGFVALGALLVAAFAAGAASRPWLDRTWARLQAVLGRRRADRRDVLQDLAGLLPELQKAGDAGGDADGQRRYLDLNLRVIEARDLVADGRIRRRVERYQAEVMELADLHREEAERLPTLDVDGEPSGEEALKRVYALLKARQDSWEALAGVMSTISEALRRLG